MTQPERQIVARNEPVSERCGFAQMMKVGVQKVKFWTPKDEIKKGL